ncbi:major capsid protein [Clostridium polynesiense]|uniref:major capsid protein n=1 Tax=Clostridium polynesiense TaxID=1325933 RepID=UPI00058D2998
MSLSKVSAKNASQEHLLAGVINVMERESKVLEHIPFKEVRALVYRQNLNTLLPKVDFRDLYTGYNSDFVEFETEVFELEPCGADADVDLVLVYGQNITDLRSEVTTIKAEAVASTVEEAFFNGNGIGHIPKGLLTLLMEGKKGTAITGSLSGNKVDVERDMDLLYQLIDGVHGGAEFLYMNKATRRKLNFVFHNMGYNIVVDSNKFGQPVTKFNGVEIALTEHLKDGVIVAVRYGVKYIEGLTNGGLSIRDLGELDSKPVLRTRIDFTFGVKVGHPRSFAVLQAAA